LHQVAVAVALLLVGTLIQTLLVLALVEEAQDIFHLV
jgi:hypothetical protein